MSASCLRPGHGFVIAIDGIRRCRMTSFLARHSSSKLGSALALKDGAKVLWLCRMVLWFVRIWCGLGVGIGMKKPLRRCWGEKEMLLGFGLDCKNRGF